MQVTQTIVPLHRAKYFRVNNIVSPNYWQAIHLSDANLSGSNLSRANLSGAIGIKKH
ncbi:MAG: pentapeptide repeat-containing protein [Chitinophagales bacterium]|nr:pentapeptide repeat-containing protein [Chitinophagales bacterium]